MEATIFEKEVMDKLIQNRSLRINKFLGDHNQPFKHRLMVYLLTPTVCRNSFGHIPNFPLFETDYGKINWEKEFPYLKRDQSVNLVTMIDFLIKGNTTYFPGHWTDDMLFLFVKDCVEQTIHEFDFYW